MKKVINFCKNNILGILFLVGFIGICVGYYFGFMALSSRLEKFLCSVLAFGSEFIWLVFLSSFAKKIEPLAKLTILNTPAVICLVIVSSVLILDYIEPGIIVPFIIMTGIISFLLGWVVFAAIARAKKLNPKDE